MYRRLISSPRYQVQSRSSQESWARLVAPLTLWICVFVTLRYGYYGNTRMVLGPSSSRLIKASSIFVKQVEVRDDDKKEVVLYGYAEKPELSDELNWNVSDYVIVGSHSRKGFSLWLNAGSRIRIKSEAQTRNVENVEVGIIKGEHSYQTLQPNPASNADLKVPSPVYGKEAEYTIDDDDKYYVGFTNTNSKSIILTVHLNVSSKMYDTSKATSVCSAVRGSCRLHLAFPSPKYIMVSTPNDGGFSEWYIELSFVARLVTYIAILGFVVLVIFLILKYFGSCDGARTTDESFIDHSRAVTETVPIMSTKQVTYGTVDDDEEEELGNSSYSSEDLYDGKICVICYDEQRNCFFVPCGHCATCYDCAQRIMAEESKVCPICRRLIHKVRRLFRA
ncbi:unnamed protein product [Rhodiola kirilowii]